MTPAPPPPPQIPLRRALLTPLIPLLLILLPSLILAPHLITILKTSLQPPLTSAAPSHSTTTSSLLPPPLSHVYTPPPTTPPPFPVPHIIRPFYHAPSSVLHVYTGGIHMGVNARNLTIAACVVGSRLYPAFLQADDVAHCRTPPVHPALAVSVVLLQDDVFLRQLRQRVVLTAVVEVQLKEGDHVVRLPHPYAYDMPFINATGGMSENERLYPRESLWLVTASQQSSPLETPSPSFPRYRFCLMTQIAPFSYLLEQWVSHHRRMGFDHIYIFDNGAALNLTHLFRNRPDVEVIQWPFDKSQRQLVGWFLRVAQMRCQFVSHMDTDELLFAPLGTAHDYSKSTPLADALHRLPAEHTRAGVKFPWVLMGNNGYENRPEGLLPELYTQRLNRQPFHNGKALCNTDYLLDSGLVHSCGRKAGAKPPLYFPTPARWETFVPPTHNGMWPVLVHFRERSWEETVQKWTVGRANGAFEVEVKKKEKISGASAADALSAYLKVVDKLKWTVFRDYCRRVRGEGEAWETVAAVVRRSTTTTSDEGGEEMQCVEIDVRTGKETGNACR